MTASPLPSSWRDHRDEPVTVAPAPGLGERPYYLPIGEFQGAEYRRNAFAAGTAEELTVLGALVGLQPGTRLLDVGCGDARHLRAAARVAGTVGVGVDVAPALIAAGRAAAAAEGVTLSLLVGDARRLPTVLGGHLATFDVAWSLCQGGLGTSPSSDPDVLAGLAAAVRPGGDVVVTLFHALFAARHLAPGDAFDPVELVHHHVGEVHGPEHAVRRFDVWTAAYTVRDARRLMADAGLELVSIRGVEPGAYGRRAAGEIGLDDPELLVHARRPHHARDPDQHTALSGHPPETGATS
jgi:SAM-dependent methyltransferase